MPSDYFVVPAGLTCILHSAYTLHLCALYGSQHQLVVFFFVFFYRDAACLVHAANPTLNTFCTVVHLCSVFVGPCHHGTARPQVADGGTASDMEGSYEKIE